MENHAPPPHRADGNHPGAEEAASTELERAFADFLRQVDAGQPVAIGEMCLKHPHLAEALQQLHDDWQRVTDLLTKPRANSSAPVHGNARSCDGIDTKILQQRLLANRQAARRYHVRGEVARGGMGVVLNVWDDDLRRHLAMKVILDRSAPDGPHGAPIDARVLNRFIEEAQITGQLDHPGIVPVHELGIDQDGRVYFTMPLVKGRDLKEIFKLVQTEAEGWTLTRALSVMIKVCEAVAFAHAKGVIHRDLKPGNIMVGRFGQVYVMDWGLARVLGREDARDLRLRSGTDSRIEPVATHRRDARDKTPDSPLVTMDGDVLGTPCYMSPEQAQGRIDRIGPRSDVYSVGAMLYHLLARQMPYVPSGAQLSPHTVLGLVANGPPEPLHRLNPDAPAELVAICEKAMARSLETRYASPMEIAKDIESYLGRRPITAVAPKLRYLARLALERNRPVALTLGASIVVLICLAVWFISSLAGEVEKKTDALDMLAAPEFLRAREQLYPLVPETVPKIDQWLEGVREIDQRYERYRARRGAATASHADSTPQNLDAIVAALIQLRELAPAVERDRELAAQLKTRTVDVEDDAWSDAIADIEDLEIYRGLTLTPQLGLIPLQRNPNSGLWEFWHVLSGTRPSVDAQGEPRLEPASGVVFVLLPGGSFVMGSPEDEPGRNANERLHTVTLDPFLISKYEVTRAQWERIMGSDPSGTREEMFEVMVATSPIHPVENVTWYEARRFAARVDCCLPTEAQWEFACRAGTADPFSWGRDDKSLRHHENVLDQSFASLTGLSGVSWSDGFPFTAPVGSFVANPYGLFDMHGNVSEWCADHFLREYPGDNESPGDGSVESADPRCMIRGGSWFVQPRFCRSAMRIVEFPQTASQSRGLRLTRHVKGPSNQGASSGKR